MTSPANKIDMAQMNAAIDKVLALPPITQAELKRRRSQRKMERALPAKPSKNDPRPAVR